MSDYSDVPNFTSNTSVMKYVYENICSVTVLSHSISYVTFEVITKMVYASFVLLA